METQRLRRESQAGKSGGRPLLLVALALLAVSWLAACGRGGEDALPPEDLTPVAIRYVAFNDQTQAGAEQVALDRFHEKEPGIIVEREAYSRNPSSYLLDEPAPDVMFLWDGLLLRSAAANGLLSDLSDVWSENGFEDAFGPEFRDLSRMEGTLYFLPGGFSWTGVYYNKDVFARYGLTPPTSWAEFMQVCDTLLANGETPLSLAGQNPFISTLWFDYLNMRMNGPQFHQDLLAGKIPYTDDRVALVWEQFMALLDQGYFIESPGVTNELSSMTALIRGDADSPLNREKAVMALATPFSTTDLPPIFRQELDFFRFPIMNANLPVGETSITFGYVIPAGAPNRPQAGVFLGFMGSVEAQELLLQQYGDDTAYVPVQREFDRSLLPISAEQGEQIVRGADDVGPPLFLRVPDQMQAGFNQVMRRLFLNTSNPFDVRDIQSILENARQEAIQAGNYQPN